ncbi:MAG: response regulator [Haloechinothrix sp.]
MLRVLVVDDHPVVRGGVENLLSATPDMDLVGVAQSARQAVLRARELNPDLVLLDLRLPDMLGSEALPHIRAAAPHAKVVMFTAHDEHAALSSALEAGAHGALLKDASDTDLIAQLRRIAAGVRVIDPRLQASSTAVLQDRLFRLSLSRREYDVIRLAATGKTNPEIADQLGLARNTVKTYLQSAMHKLGARNRVEAVRRAQEEQLL